MHHRIAIGAIGAVSLAFGLLAWPGESVLDGLIVGAVMFAAIMYVYLIVAGSIWFRRRREAQQAEDPRAEAARLRAQLAARQEALAARTRGGGDASSSRP